MEHGKTLDPLVEKYQKSIKNAEKIIIISPLWWNDVPAILKGFIDEVMKMDFAYEVTKTGVKGRLTNVQEAIVITTATSPTWYLRWFLVNPIRKNFFCLLAYLPQPEQPIFIHISFNMPDIKRI